MKAIKNLSDLTPDKRNANKGTVRGYAMVEESFSRCGAGRSILVDKNGKIIAGNSSTDAAGAVGIEQVVVVPVDGNQLVVVQRVDLDLDTDPIARELAYADNRAGQMGLEWNLGVLESDIEDSSLDLSWMFRNDELAELRGIIPDDADSEMFNQKDRQKKGRQSDDSLEVVIVCESEREVERAKREISELGYYIKGE